MIGSLSYDEFMKYAESLKVSSDNLKKLLKKYESYGVGRVFEFCDTIDSYSRYLSSTVQLYKDSDAALKNIIEKNK